MTNNRPIVFVLLGLFCTLTLSAQQPPSPQNPSPGVIRIDVNLVQVDAVVTDNKGRPVTDLKAEDFELFQDGVRQKINNVEFIKVKDQGPGPAPAPQVVTKAKNGAVPPPPRTTSLNANQIRRTIALVVDDLGLSFDSVVHIRESLKKWVDNEMQQGDLVAVVRTSSGMGSLQRFTMDKQILQSAIDLIQPHNGRVGTSTFNALRGAQPTDGVLDTSVFDDEVEHAYLVGSLGAIQYVVRGLRDLPGRKSLVLFSESMRFTYLEGPGLVASTAVTNATNEERLRKLTDEANRSSVVIYAVDPRGSFYDGLTAEDTTSGLEEDAIRQSASNRTTQMIESRDGMYALTQRTGGLFVHDSNDLGGLLRQVVDDGDGYYLIGYTPELSTFDQGTGKAVFHKISLRVNRSGLSVRSRTGFFGRPDNPALPPDEAQRAQLARALVSPFATGDVGVKLTGLFFPALTGAGSIKVLLHIDPNNLTFTEEPDGAQVAEVEIASVTFDADGQQVDAVGEGSRIRIPKEDFDAVQRNGVVYTGQLPVKKAGGYQLRVVVRDKTTKKLGSAMQFIDVPDLKNGRLALSGIVMAEQLPKVPGGSPVAGTENAGTFATPANRVFKSGASLVFAYEVLNARGDADKKPQLDAQVRVFRDGMEIYEGKAETLSSTETPTNLKRIPFSGGIELSKLSPGRYTLQLIVADNNRYDKYHMAAQAIDFEVKR
jgi:VWFA-related protein